MQVTCSARCLFLVCLFVRTELSCFSLQPLDGLRKKKFNIGVTTHVECFNDNYDVIGYVLWQPYWKKKEKLWTSISKAAQRKKLKLGMRHHSSTPHGVYKG